MVNTDDRPQTIDDGQRQRKGNFFLFFSLWTMVCGLWSNQAFACPSCTDLIKRGKGALEAMQFGEGVSFSIYFMFLIPIILILAVGFAFYRSYQKAQQKRESV